MNIGKTVVKTIKTNRPQVDVLYSQELRKVIEKQYLTKFKEAVIYNTDKIMKHPPEKGYFKVYEDDRVEIYQQNKSVNRWFVIKEQHEQPEL